MKKYLDFDEIKKECEEHYEKSPHSYDWSEKNKKIFFRDRKRAYSHYIKLIVDEKYPSLQETKLKWVILGDFFEFILKICLLRENWANLNLIYDSKKRKYYGFRGAKHLLLNSLKKKLNEKQFKRTKEILDFVNLQRNNFIHNPISGSDHYAIETQCLKLILTLNEFYSLDFNEEDILKIKNRIEHFKANNSGMDFEKVELI